MNQTKTISRVELLQWIEQFGDENTDNLKISSVFAGYVWQKDSLLVVPNDKSQDEEGPINLKVTSEEELIQRPLNYLEPEEQTSQEFYRINHHKPIEFENDDHQITEPISIAGIKDFQPNDLIPSEPSAQIHLDPLIGWERLWPKLKSIFSSSNKDKIDIKSLVNSISNGQILNSFPYMEKQQWSSDGLIIVDYRFKSVTFWDDFNFLLYELIKIRGQRGLTILEQSEKYSAHFMNWKNNQNDGFFKIPNPNTPFLILSDLGQLDQSKDGLNFWIRFGRKLNDNGIKPFVLCPVSQHKVFPELCQLYNIIIWDRSSTLQPQKYRKTPYNANKNLDRLLVLLSPAVRIEPKLLREVRHLILDPTFEAGLEAEFWHHLDVISSNIACIIKNDRLIRYRKEFCKEPKKIQLKILEILHKHHATLFPSVAHYETLIWKDIAHPTIISKAQEKIDFADHFLKKTARMLYNRRHSLSKNMELYGKRLLDRSHPSLISSNLCLSVIEGVVNLDQLTSGLPLRRGINKEELERTISQKNTHPRTINFFQDRKKLIFLDKSRLLQIPESYSFISSIKTITSSISLETSDDDNNTKQIVLKLTPSSSFEYSIPLSKLFTDVKIIGSHEEITLKLQEKPSWALSQTLDQDGISLDFYQRGHKCRISWPKWGGKLNKDKNGVYVELNVEGATQRFNWIEPGTFQMGSPVHEALRQEREMGEEDIHRVTLTKGFWMADTACTQELWLQVMGDNPALFASNKNNPVESISWNDANEFCQRINQLVSGLSAKLPTEAQWEYSCRAGTGSAYSFGDKVTKKLARYNHTGDQYRKGSSSTSEVKSYPSNQWGLYEMHGNVWEWCKDFFAPYSKYISIDDPSGPKDGTRKVSTGGSWQNLAHSLRSARRGKRATNKASNAIGFRFILGENGYILEKAKRIEQPSEKFITESIFSKLFNFKS